jgi:RNA polymerase sigma factor (sigma-70 family)
MAADPNFGLSEKEFKRLQQGDTRLQLKIFDTNAASFVKIAKDKWGVSTEVAEEFVSTAFAKLFMHIQSERVQLLNLRGYVYGGLEFEWLDFFDKQKRTTHIFPNLTTKDTDNSLLERLNWAFIQLCEKCQKLLSDHYWEGKKYKEIGDELGITEEAARQRKKECIKKMQKTLGTTGKETKNYDFSSN